LSDAASTFGGAAASAKNILESVYFLQGLPPLGPPA
jgi:hypothetical protein